MLWEEGVLPQSDVENLIEETIRKEKEQSNLPDKTNSGISFERLKGAIKRIFDRGEK